MRTLEPIPVVLSLCGKSIEKPFMKFKIAIAVFGVLFFGRNSPAQVPATQSPTGKQKSAPLVENFEGQTVASRWGVTNGTLAIELHSSKERSVINEVSKDDAFRPEVITHYLSWTANSAASVLTCHWPEGFAGITADECLSFEISCDRPQPSDAPLTLELLHGSQVVGTIPMKLIYNWQGHFHDPQWNRVDVYYEQFGLEAGQVDGFRVFPPDNIVPAQLLIRTVKPHDSTPRYYLESFESKSVLDGWSATNSELSLSQDHYKSGGQSLAWSWTAPNATLTCVWPRGFSKIKEGEALSGWIYSETELPALLYFELLYRGHVIGKRAWYVLNFKGWRSFYLPYAYLGRDSKQPLDGFRLIAPGNVVAGRLFLDCVATRCPADALIPDAQQPWIVRQGITTDRKLLDDPNPEKYIMSTHDISWNRPWLPKPIPIDQITAQQWHDLDELGLRTDSMYVRTKPIFHTTEPVTADQLAALLKRCREDLGIHRQNGCINGKPFVVNREREHNPMPDVVHPEEVVKLYDDLCTAYLGAKMHYQPVEAQKLLEAFYDTCDYMLDNDGEGNNRFRVFPGGAAGFGNLVWPIRALGQELRQTGRLRGLALLAWWTAQGGACLLEDFAHPNGFTLWGVANTDETGNYEPLPCAVSLILDPVERLQRLQVVTRMVDKLCDPKLGEPFGEDGTTVHHSMHHVEYAYVGGLRAMVHMAYQLRNTSFHVASETLSILKRTVFVNSFAAYDEILAPNQGGYTGQAYYLPTKAEAYQLARCGSPDGKQPIDSEMAALFLSMVKDSDPVEYTDAAHEFRAMGIKPYVYNGHVTMNAAAIAVHRRANWLVDIAGMFGGRGGLESNTGPYYLGSVYSTYCRNGSLLVWARQGKPPSIWNSGYNFSGWNYFCWPGTTAPIAPWDSPHLRGNNSNTNLFGGGTTLDADGIWGMLYQPFRQNDDVHFHKSAFCFGNRITVLTSNIERGELRTERPVVTTLYQNTFGAGYGTLGSGPDSPAKPVGVSPAQEPSWVDGKEVREFPTETVLRSGTAHYLMDNKGNGYYIHAGGPPVRVMRHAQKWFYHMSIFAKDPEIANGPWNSEKWIRWRDTAEGMNPTNYNITSSDFALAYFEHGTEPTAPACAYTLIPQTTPETVATLANAMSNPATAPYRILEQDARAHIVRDNESKTTGYVLFDAGKVAADGALQEVNCMCWVMLRDTAAGGLRVSVASTVLAFWERNLQLQIDPAAEIVLTLKGQWNIQSLDADAPKGCRTELTGGVTRLHIPYQSYMPVCLNLNQVK